MCTGKRQTRIRNAPSSRTAATGIAPYEAFSKLSEILRCFKFRGKSPEKPKGFFWSVQGGPEGNRNPSGLVFFCQRFLLEKQKKMLKGSRKFLISVLTLSGVSSATKKGTNSPKIIVKSGASRRAEQSPAPTKIVRILKCS